jgi:hypothetical protein
MIVLNYKGRQEANGLSPANESFDIANLQHVGDVGFYRVMFLKYGCRVFRFRNVVPYVNDVNILGGSAHTVKENAEALVVATKEIGLEVNADKTKYMIMS